jgi:hypothetical protein
LTIALAVIQAVLGLAAALGALVANKMLRDIERLRRDHESVVKDQRHFVAREDVRSMIEDQVTKLSSDVQRLTAEITTLHQADSKLLLQLGGMVHKDDLRELRSEMNSAFDKLFARVDQLYTNLSSNNSGR